MENDKKKEFKVNRFIKSDKKTASNAIDSMFEKSHLNDLENANSVLIQGEKIFELIKEGITSPAKLSEIQKKYLYIYFFTYNPLLRRIVNIQTNLPMSNMGIQKPEINNDIVQDYVYSFFKSMLNQHNWKKVVYQAVLQYWIFGESQILIEDDFNIDKETDVEDDDFIMEQIRITTEKQNDAISELVGKYNKDKNSLTYDEIDAVINATIPNYNKDYKGVKSMRVINPFDISAIFNNEEINYNEYEINRSSYIEEYYSDRGGQDIKDLVKDLSEVGYTYSYVMKNINSIKESESNLRINDDPYNDEGIYMAHMDGINVCGVNTNIMDAILDDLIKYHTAVLKEKDKMKLMDGKIFVLSVDEDISDDQLEELKQAILDSASNPDEGNVVAVNYSVSTEDLDMSVKDSMDNSTLMEDAIENIQTGTGTPTSLVSGDDSYGSSYLKFEVLNEEFAIFRMDIGQFLEDQIFKPIAIKKGFVSSDVFGNLKPIYPKVNFRIGTIVNTSDFKDTLENLVGDGKVSNQTFMEYIGIDPEDEAARIVEEKKYMEDMGLDDDN